MLATARRRVRDDHQAKDAVSETYIRLLENWDKFSELHNEIDCLKLAKVILIFVLIDEYRKTVRAKKFAESERVTLITDDENEAYASDASFLVNKILSMVKLTKKESTILQFVIKGLPNREVAKALGVTPEEVGKSRYTLIRKLQKVVQRNRIKRD
ncbi:MAG: sigma-70 family RNA polymerase sigma factor [Saprospiraceae bacterium]|nr:sigma-70 family RNA polymerase sigma factor [Saprospiraceae bacterium]